MISFPITGDFGMRFRTLEDDFVKSLMESFDIKDRDPLVRAVLAAANASTNNRLFGRGGHWTTVESDALDALGAPLRKSARLLRIASRAIALELSVRHNDEFAGKTADEIKQQIEAMSDRLNFVADAVGQAPRNRRPQSRPEHERLRAMVAPLAEYWRCTLGRRFTDNQRWALGHNGEEPTTAATKFVYAVVEHLDRGAGSGLKTVAREFTGPPSSPS
ncbi:MAG TPA: hypothetical protein VGG57_15035, partial [Stellaceae bacterium]